MKERRNAPKIRFNGFTEEWEQRKLGEISETTIGEFVIRTKQNPQGPYPVYNGGKSYTGFYDEFNNEGNKIIVSARGAAGYVNIVKQRYWAGNSCYSVGLKEKEQYDIDFVYQYMKRNQCMFLKNLQAANIPSVSKRDVETFDISAPSFAEQRQIGAFFRSLDRLISLHSRKYSRLVNIKKSMLEKMFPKPGADVPEIRFAGFTDAWKQRKLGEVVEEVTRNDPFSTAPIMMITANNGFIDQSERYAFNNAGESLKKYILLEKGELAYNHGASKLRPYGSCFALTTAERARIPFVYHCFSTKSNDPEFLSLELNGKGVENQLRKIVSSGARMDGLLNISFEEYSTITLQLPSIEEQITISAFFRSLDRLISLHLRKLERLQNIKKSFLEKMFV